ncbi:MAG: lipocalin family protein [Bacteroidales bacterium]
MKTILVFSGLFLFSLLYGNAPTTVSDVDLNRYAGVWYEIARYPQWFEKGMTHVTAEYIPKKDYIEVINKGYKNGKPKEAHGKAFVVENSGNAKLRVQFFWPFRGDYWIIALAPDYSWAVVSNKKKSTLWILSRTPALPENTLHGIIRLLRQREFDTGKLEFVKQD